MKHRFILHLTTSERVVPLMSQFCNLYHSFPKFAQATIQQYEPTISSISHPTCCQDSTSSTPLLVPFQLLVSFRPLKVVSLKIPAG